MTEQLAFLRGYEAMVADMLAAFPEQEAMERAVGGDYNHFGVLEHAVLLLAGMQPTSAVLDVGCGSGRLALQLARYPELAYHGTDIVEALLDYARRKIGRSDFRFTRSIGHELPATAESTDFVTFFSVFTHMLPEESYAYLLEAMRVLRPGGRAVFSFLDPTIGHNWPIFEAGVKWVQTRTVAGHLNVFLHPQQLQDWAGHLGAEVEMIIPGDGRCLEVGPDMLADGVQPGSYAFGQSLAVLRKPLAPLAALGLVVGAVDHSPSPKVLGGWARLESEPTRRLQLQVTQYGKVIGTGATGVERPDVGTAGFWLELSEPVDDSAVLAGQVVVSVPQAGGVQALPFYDGLLAKLRQRRLVRGMIDLSPAERAAVLAEFFVPAPGRDPSP
jgi:SAM-dependent methyltransferase